MSHFFLMSSLNFIEKSKDAKVCRELWQEKFSSFNAIKLFNYKSLFLFHQQVKQNVIIFSEIFINCP